MKATYGEKYPYAKPWPYEKKRFTLMHEFFDSSIDRINENSKVIAVEGNVAVGKTDFAKRLAEDFDLKFFPATPDDNCFNSNPYKFDIRSLDEMMPETARSYDMSKFLADPNPHSGKVGSLQLLWYKAKFMTYVSGLKHLLNTGQGVVLVRSVYSDMVFAEAMRQMGWLTKKFMPYYYDYRDNSLCELLKPHLTIYLDAPVSVIKERIKKRANPHELQSAQMSDEYLKAVEKVYKQKFLPKMRESGEVMEVEWTEVGDEVDMHVIAAEIQLLELENEDNEDPKFADWTDFGDDEYAYYRKAFFSDNQLEGLFNRPAPWDCPEVMLSQEDHLLWQKVVQQHPCIQYDPGWAPQLGHNTMLKLW